jgi:hypothetical protein
MVASWSFVAEGDRIQPEAVDTIGRLAGVVNAPSLPAVDALADTTALQCAILARPLRS